MVNPSMKTSQINLSESDLSLILFFSDDTGLSVTSTEEEEGGKSGWN